MVFVLHMMPDLRCHGCGHIGYIDRKSQLCAHCVGTVLEKRKTDRALLLSANVLGSDVA
jgi:hypothetical protein